MALVQAHIVKVEQEIGSEWATIHTDDSTVKKLTTKRPELVSEAAGFKNAGVLVGIDYTERSKTVQTENGPRTYRDFYYNGGGALGNGASASTASIPGVDMVPSGTTRGEDPDRSWRICLQSGGKLAVATLPLLPEHERTPADQLILARFWAEFFFFTPRPNEPSNAMQPSGYTYEPQGIDAPPPYDDSDIPY